MLKVTIQGGTAKHDGRSLCETCKLSTVVKGETLDQEIIRCSELRGVIRFRVRECSSYKHKNTLDLWDMQQLAWPLATKKGKVIGFLSPSEAAARAKAEEIDALIHLDED